MKKRYLVAILVVIAACITTFNYTLNIPSPLPTGKLIPRPSNYYKWSLTGASFITTPVQIGSPVVGAQTKHTCLSGNDESCFLITVWSGDYKSYFTAYRTAIFDQMITATGSTLTTGDRDMQIAAGFTQVLKITGTNNTTRQLVDIGLESQHLYIERPRGTLIITDSLGLKGPSYTGRQYINYTDMPMHIVVQ